MFTPGEEAVESECKYFAFTFVLQNPHQAKNMCAITCISLGYIYIFTLDPHIITERGSKGEKRKAQKKQALANISKRTSLLKHAFQNLYIMKSTHLEVRCIILYKAGGKKNKNKLLCVSHGFNRFSVSNTLALAKRQAWRQAQHTAKL